MPAPSSCRNPITDPTRLHGTLQRPLLASACPSFEVTSWSCVNTTYAKDLLIHTFNEPIYQETGPLSSDAVVHMKLSPDRHHIDPTWRFPDLPLHASPQFGVFIYHLTYFL